jgi:hypothetical protein
MDCNKKSLRTWKGFFIAISKSYLCVESVVVVVPIPAADESVPIVVLVVVFVSVVIVVVVFVESALSLLFELSLQATNAPVIAKRVKSFFMLRYGL